MSLLFSLEALAILAVDHMYGREGKEMYEDAKRAIARGEAEFLRRAAPVPPADSDKAAPALDSPCKPMSDCAFAAGCRATSRS